MMDTGGMSRHRRRGFGGKFRAVGSFGAHVFFLHLIHLGVDGGTGRLHHASVCLFRQGFLATLFLHFFKAEGMLHPAFLGVEFFLQAYLFLLGDFLLRPFQLLA